jgi:hypothetical protein
MSTFSNWNHVTRGFTRDAIDGFAFRLIQVRYIIIETKEVVRIGLIDWCLTSSEQFFSYIQDENIKKFKRHRTRNKERWWVGTDDLASATGLLWTTHHEHIMLIMSCYTGFFNVRRGWQSLNTGPLFYLRLIRRTGWLWIYTFRRSSRSHFYPPRFPRGWPLSED